MPVSLTVDEIQLLGSGGAVVRDRLLGDAAAEAIARELRALPLAPAGMGRHAVRWVERAERGDDIGWIEPSEAPPPLAPLVAAFTELGDELRCGACLPIRRFDLQAARYREPGARYARHVDAFRSPSGHGEPDHAALGHDNRCVTAIYYANPGWSAPAGGKLRLYLDDGERDLAPILDRLVVFASDRVSHEVLPSWADRCAITAWYYGN